jgi:triphosphoribosyl-dephospho-CoA synthase
MDTVRSKEVSNRIPTHSTPEMIAAAAQLACLLEASAAKPGNVTPTHAYVDMHYGDFLRSAVAIGPAMTSAANQSIGTTILSAVEATRRWTCANTNLGIVLLFAPLAKAAAGGMELRAGLRKVLRELTLDDARLTYQAIRLAEPGGLEASVQHDVRDEPEVTLLEAMRSAADRDSIAAEYVTDYAITFEHGLPALKAALARGATDEQVVVQTYLELLAKVPDTLIARKRGIAAAQAVSQRAEEVIRHGGVWSEEGRRAITELDHYLRKDGNALNPGTTADLVAATLFVAFLEGVLR